MTEKATELTEKIWETDRIGGDAAALLFLSLLIVDRRVKRSMLRVFFGIVGLMYLVTGPSCFAKL